MLKRGKLITLEGVDGAGKSTHVDFIWTCLRNRGHTVLATREPGGTPLAEKIRALVLAEPMEALAETLLMFAARADHIYRVIEPALAAGTWVLCDRFTDATAAYQGGGKGVPQELIRRLADAVHPRLQPDATLLFDCPYETARLRLERGGRPLDRFEREDQAFFERVRSTYLQRAATEPARMRVIDASKATGEVRAILEKELSTV